MAYDFFFSYARADNNVYLQQFFKDLSDEVRSWKGDKAEVEVGFFDQRDIELGEDWDATIVDALATSAVVIAAASPGYFKSDYCGRELALFERRLPPGTAAGGFPPVIKPLVWVPFPAADVPSTVGARQFTYGDPESPLNKIGMRSMLKLMSVHAPTYVPFVNALARQIVDVGKAHPLPLLTDVPRLGGVHSWFAPKDPTAPATIDEPTPDRVHFIYVAASPSQFGPARDPDPYLRAGGAEWKPFFPDDTRPIHRFLQQVVSSDDLKFTSDEVAFGADLIAKIENAWKQRSIVVLIVDAWSVYWDAEQGAPGYLGPLQALDGRNFHHCSVLVPWNETDPEVRKRGVALTQALQNVLPFRVKGNALYYRDGLTTFEQLKHAVAEILVRLRDEVRGLAPVAMPIPAGPSKSVISGSRR